MTALANLLMGVVVGFGGALALHRLLIAMSAMPAWLRVRFGIVRRRRR